MNVAPRPERWIVALETAVQIPGKRRPTLGYTVFADAEPFDSFEAASAFIKENNLPIGWVAMQDTHNPWPALFPEVVAMPSASLMQRVVQHLEAQATYTPSERNRDALQQLLAELRATLGVQVSQPVGCEYPKCECPIVGLNPRCGKHTGNYAPGVQTPVSKSNGLLAEVGKHLIETAPGVASVPAPDRTIYSGSLMDELAHRDAADQP